MDTQEPLFLKNRRERKEQEEREYAEAPIQFLNAKCDRLEKRVDELEGVLIQMIPMLQKMTGEKIKW